MTHSIVALPATQPEPADANKLTRRQSDGRYCKKVRGQMHYFGRDYDAAMAEWLRIKDDLLAGRKPRPKPADDASGVTVQYVCNAFLTDKATERDAGQLATTTWIDYERLCKRLVKEMGSGRSAADLGPDDFRQLRASLSKTCGLNTLLPTIVKVRTVFNHAVDNRLIDRPPFYGSAFDLPSAKERRVYRARQEAEQGKKMFEAAELVKLIDSAGVHLRAMIYLGINCGYGNADAAGLLIRSLDLDGGWVDQPRSKTGIERRCKLWPETVAAIKASLAKRPTPKDPANERFVFITKYGATWGKSTMDNPIAKAFTRLVKEVELEQTGRGFLSLRHTFRTKARHARDTDAVRYIMGHVNAHVETTYEHEPVEDDRLEAVVNVVRTWLLAARRNSRVSLRSRPFSTSITALAELS